MRPAIDHPQYEQGAGGPQRGAARGREPNRPPRALALILLLGITTLVGCAPLNFNLRDFSFNDEDEPVTPSRMIPVWTDTVLTRAGKPGVRGFGGRLVFYENGQQAPVRVKGSIVVYAWDDSDKQAANRPPDRKYVVTAEELARHFSVSRVGPSYSIWVPWDKVGGEHRQISLVTRFIGVNGAELVSQPVAAVLPGPVSDRMIVSKSTLEAKPTTSPEQSDEPALDHPDAGNPMPTILQAGWESPANTANAPPNLPRMTTTTLNVSPSFAKQHFRDNGLPLNLNGDSSEDDPRNPDFHGYDAAAPSVTGSQQAQAAPAGRPRSAHSQRAPRPARIERPVSPVPSPLRNPPRRAKWPFHHSATPQSRHETATPATATPTPESAVPGPPPAVDLLQSRS